MSRKSAAALLALLVTVGLGAGCAPATRSAAGMGGEDDAVTVRVENQNWADMNVYVLRAGTRLRLGTVTTASSARFRLPAALGAFSSDLQLLADPIGSGAVYTSPSFMVGPGEQIFWRVENSLPLSSLSVRRTR